MTPFDAVLISIGVILVLGSCVTYAIVRQKKHHR